MRLWGSRPARLGYACLLALPVLPVQGQQMPTQQPTQSTPQSEQPVQPVQPQQSTQTQLPAQSQLSTQQYSMQGQEPPSTVATLTPFAEETFTTDDNVFRITNDVPPQTLIGFPARGDTYRTTSAGLAADVPVSLQRFDLSASYTSSRYDRFHELDFDGYTARGDWLWQVGRFLSGDVGITASDALESFAQLLSVTPDHLKSREAFAKGSWLFTPDWKLYAGADQLVQSNSNPADSYNDVTVNSFETSLSRLTTPDEWVGIDARYENGHFPNGEPVGTELIDNGYNQYSGGIVLDWGANTPSHFVARADQVSRHYDELPQRNFDLTTAHLMYTWTPTGKLELSAVAERDISPYEYIRSSVVLIKGLALRPLWHITPKLDLSADLEAMDRNYMSDPLTTLGFQPQRDDHVYTMSGLLSYMPIRQLTVSLSAMHEQRTTNIALSDYFADVYWLKVRLSL